MEHRKAPEIERVAREVMAEHHALLDQRGPRVEWVMTKPEKPSGSVPDWKIKRITGVHAYLALDDAHKPEAFPGGPPDKVVMPVRSFIAVEVSERYWHVLDAGQREAMCDHVLAHLVYDYEKGTWRVEGPEFGEFEEVLERRGFWRPDRRLLRFAEGMAEQLSLLGDVMSETGAKHDEDYDDDGEEEGNQERLDVSITHNGRTVHTDTDTMREVSEGLADGSIEVGPSGERVDAETGEVLEEAGSRS